MQRLLRKFETAKVHGSAAGAPHAKEKTKYGVHLLRLDVGGDGRGFREPVEQGLHLDTLRIRAFRLPTRSWISSMRTSRCS